MNAFQPIKTLEFFQSEQTSYRLQVVKINSKAYVGFGKFFFNARNQKWEPTKKQVFVPRSAWAAIQPFVEQVTSLLAANPGISTKLIMF